MIMLFTLFQIDHQAETISQLRKEAQQWKDQFMRVEEERSRLSSRVDELVAQQLYVRVALILLPRYAKSSAWLSVGE